MSVSLWGFPFFGLTSAYRLSLFEQIHDIVFNGQGGYDYNTIYNMPIWLRKFTLNKIHKYYKKQAEQLEEVKNKGKTTFKTKAKKPNVKPSLTYNAKTPSKQLNKRK